MVAFDPNERRCGIDDEVKDYPLIYLAVPWTGYLNHTACVKACPTWDIGSLPPTSFDCKPNKIV